MIFPETPCTYTVVFKRGLWPVIKRNSALLRRPKLQGYSFGSRRLDNRDNRTACKMAFKILLDATEDMNYTQLYFKAFAAHLSAPEKLPTTLTFTRAEIKAWILDQINR